MTHKHGPGRYDWEGQLTGRDPILGRGGNSYGPDWWFRADSGGWAFQTWGSRPDMIGTRGDDVLIASGEGAAVHEAAWAIVEDCLDGKRAGALTAIGRNGKAPAWSPANTEITEDDPLLHGQVRGDLTAQPRGGWYSIHRYADDPRTCRQCGTRFVFTASEQRRWYEVRKFIVESHPVRCPRCRREKRATRAVTRRLFAAVTAVDAAPGDARAHLALAVATLELRTDRGEGDVQRAVHAARTAQALDASLAVAVGDVLAGLRAAG